MRRQQYSFIIIGFAICVLCQSIVYSQCEKLGVGTFIGAVKMVGGDIDRSTIDQWGGLALQYQATELLHYELNFGYGWVHARDPNDPPFQSTRGYKTLLYPMNFNLRFVVPYVRRFYPSLILGLGMTRWDVRKMDAKGSSLIKSGHSVYGPQMDFTTLYGLGVRTSVTRQVSLDISYRFHWMLKGNEDTMGLGDDANKGVSELRASIYFYLSALADTDGDGIKDKYDLDVERAEDIDGFQDNDGKPDPDNDGDRIPDLLDDDPLNPEDYDGYMDDDGRPDPDNDMDGIPDSDDECINDPEDIDGFEDDDGCPDYDNDQDTIPDSLDKCPNWPEDKNGYMDHDGCPDEKPQPPPYKIGDTIASRSSRMNLNELRIFSYGDLETIIDILTDFPTLQIMMKASYTGIASVTTSRHIKKELTRIREYIISSGIAPERVKNDIEIDRSIHVRKRNGTGSSSDVEIEILRIK